MEEYEKLLVKNKSWSNDKKESDPDFFKHLAQQQTPKFLWIGCSDSRVPADEITSSQPGELFVHRNIANLVLTSDINMLAVLEYAVHHLRVENIIVCGHYGCGGINAALSHDDYGLINKWLWQIKDVYLKHETELDCLESDETRANALVELNVKEQVFNLMKTGIIQKAWKKYGSPTIHGWVYGLNDGVLKDLCKVQPGSRIHPMYVYNLDEEEKTLRL